MSLPAPERVVIIGGGIMGVCTAYYLSRAVGPRASITLIEGTSIAAAASGRAGGLLALDWHGKSTESLAELSWVLHAQLAKEHGGAERWGYRTLDTLSLEVDCSPSSRMTGSAKARSKQRDAFEWIGKSLQGSKVLGTERSTAQVHPFQFTTAIFELAQAAGVAHIAGTAISLSEQGERYVEVQTADARVKVPFDKLLIAAGPWTGGFLRQLYPGSKVGGRGRTVGGERAHSVVLRPAASLPSLPAQAWFTSIKTSIGEFQSPEIYNRPDGTAYCCGSTDPLPLPDTAADVHSDPLLLAQIVSQVGELSPLYLKVGDGAHNASIEVQQACYLPTETTTGNPVLGQVAPAVFVAAGHSCWGITNGPGTGKCMAELLLEGAVRSADISSLAP